MKFNLYKGMTFPSDENASCMRIDTLIPSQDEMLYDFGKRSSLEQCLTKSVSTKKICYGRSIINSGTNRNSVSI